MKILLSIFVGITALYITACDKKDDATSDTGSTELSGSWKSSCLEEGSNFSSRTTLTFSGANSVTQVYERFDAAACPAAKAHTTVQVTGTFTLGSAAVISNAKNIDFSITAATATPISSTGLSYFNSTPACSGKTNWAMASQSVAGLVCSFGTGSKTFTLPYPAYTIYNLTGSVLTLGTTNDIMGGGATSGSRSPSMSTTTYSKVAGT